MGGLAAVFRTIRNTLLDIDSGGFPAVVKSFQDFKDGLILVGGPTGSGKSTTLAALIDAINRKSGHHILSIEDPIEVVHANKKSLVNQREIGAHVLSFGTALRAALRQDPDVLLIGEVRDFDTISAAVSAAETGHLVFGSVHTTSAATTVDRLVSAAPSSQQDHMRSLLAGSLRAVLCQYLLTRLSGGRCLAVEILINNDAVASLIRKGKSFQIPSVIATAREQGMQLMDSELMRLFKEGLVSAEEVYMKSANKKDFENLDGVAGAKP
jgi:twitching motility protein PilT